MASSKRIILSVGGSIIIPKEGFDTAFLKQFERLIRNEVKKEKKFIFVIGGGNTARVYQTALKDTVRAKDEMRDMIGIAATRLNAEFIRLLFADIAYKEVLIDPTVSISTTKSVIVCAGWKPGFSTDTVAVHAAKTFGADYVLNLSNISHAYDMDPQIYSQAKKIANIDWKSFRKIVGDKWIPGKSAPFDPIASKEAEKIGLNVFILDGKNLMNVKKAIEGKPFDGTRIEG